MIITQLCEGGAARSTGGCDTLGFTVRLRELLLDELPCLEEARAPLEEQHNRGLTRHGLQERSTVTPPSSRSPQIGLKRHRVTSCSTSSAESPSASVWTSTVGGRGDSEG